MLDRGHIPSLPPSNLLPPTLVVPPSESPRPSIESSESSARPAPLRPRQPYNRRRVLTRFEGTDVLSAVISQLPALLQADCEYILARVAVSPGH